MDMIYTIDEIRQIVSPIVQKYRIPTLYLFGSYARGDATEDSDIDFLVDTAGTDLTSLLRLGALYCELEEAFGKRIDLLTVGAVMQKSEMPSDKKFKDAILKERVCLHDAA